MKALMLLQLQLMNQRYTEDFHHWMMPFQKTPTFSFCQTTFELTFIGTGYVLSHHPTVNGIATTLAQLLMYEEVKKLIDTKVIMPSLAREWGAILQYAKFQVPFNLIVFGLEGADMDLADYPVPKMDQLVLISLLLPTEDAVLYFKLWYEDGHPDLNFKRDLIMPLLTYWGWYCDDHHNIRGFDFSMGSISLGSAASYELADPMDLSKPLSNCTNAFPEQPTMAIWWILSPLIK